MIRVFHPAAADWTPGAPLELSAEESHHLCSVLRSPAGTPLVLLDGAGRTADALLETPHKKHAIVRIPPDAPPVLAPPPRFRRILLQALIREQRMDAVIQKAVELGASEIWPLQTNHAIVRIDPRDAPRKTERWTSIALAACKQSGNPWLPEILPPQTLRQALDRLAARSIRAFYGALVPGAIPLPDLLRELVPPPTPSSSSESQPASRPSSLVTRHPALAAIIGPEGDFSPAEYALLAQTPSLRPATFGPLVLRAETAAIFALSALLCASL